MGTCPAVGRLGVTHPDPAETGSNQKIPEFHIQVSHPDLVHFFRRRIFSTQTFRVAGIHEKIFEIFDFENLMKVSR